ncbi:MAG: hypothetical protein C0391_06205 [Anaerolinea sp.]|nr:hypothetical protein [Anaerolinea sp.]
MTLPTTHMINPKYVIAGSFSRDFVIPASQFPRLDFMGGNAAFSAAGLALWDKPVGIISRVGADFPQEWLSQLDAFEIDHRGVKTLAENIDLRHFYGYNQDGTFQTGSPVGRFAAIEYPIPLDLLNYSPEKQPVDDLRSRRPTSPLSTDIPVDYHDAIAAHLCPMDFITQSLLQTVLRSGEIKTITLEADPAYLLPENWKSIPTVVSGLSCFTVDEEPISLFFRGRTIEPLEMASALGSMGSEHIIIRKKGGGKLLYQHSTNRNWLIPDYPVKKVNAHSSQHAFSGGYLAGYILTYDPLLAMAYGNVSESIAAEGLHPLSIFEALPGLAQARLKILTEQVTLL